MESKINFKKIRLILLVSLVIIIFGSVLFLQSENKSFTASINSFAGKITGLQFSIPEISFSAAAGSKPIAGFVFKYDGVTPAENATVIVYVNISDITANPCFTLPSVLSGSDGSYSTNLNNLKRADNITQTCNWNSSDPIWAEANGSTMSPTEGYGISNISYITDGSVPQYLNNITLSKGDTILPNVTLVSPSNGSILTDHTITFEYNVSDNRGIKNCSLVINNVLQQTDLNVTNNATNNFTQFLVNGDYNWSIFCYDTSDNYQTSPNWTFTVSVLNLPPQFAVPTDDYSTTASPTNIGNNVVFTTNATDPDLDNYKLIVCNSSSISQSGICSETLICQSPFVASSTYTSCQHSTVGETAQSYTWYSFVCDALNCSDYNNTNSPYYLNFYPYYSTIPLQNWSEDTQHSINLSDYFTDPDSDELNYTAPAQPNITININNTNKIVTFIPDPDWYGTATINFTATDPYGLSNTSNNFILNVTNINDPPVLQNITDKSTEEDIAPPENWIDLYNYSYDVDYGYIGLTYTLVSQSNSSLINCALISNRYINCSAPAPDEFGVNYLIINVTDGEYTVSAFANITVISVNDPPSESVPEFPPPGEITNNATPFFNSSDSNDTEGDLITYSLLIDCDGASGGFTDITQVTLRQDSNISEWLLNQSLPEGYCSWTILVCDDSNTSTACTLSNQTYDILIDLSPPNVVIEEPDNNEILGWDIPLYNDVFDRWTDIDQAWFYITNSTGSVVESGNLYGNSTPPWSYFWDSSSQFGVSRILYDDLGVAYFKVLSEFTKNFTYTVFANDTLGHVANDSVNFSVDQTIPSINIIYPKFDNLSGDFILDIRVQSYNLTESWYNITDENGTIQYAYNQTNLTNVQSWNWTDFINVSGWPSGVYNITAYALDASNSSRNSTTYFNLDVDPPAYSNPLHSPDPAYNDNNVYLNVTWTDNNLVDLVYISHNASGSWVNFTAQNNGSNYYINISPILLSNQEIIGWRSVAKDNFGNWNDTMPIQSFQITNRPPVLNNSIPNLTWPEDTINNSLYLNQYFYDPDGDNLSFSSSTVQNITVNISSSTTQVTLTPEGNFTGVRNVVFYAGDNFNTTPSNNITLNVTPVNDPPFMNNITLTPNFGPVGTVVNITTVGAGDIDGDSYQLQCGNTSGVYNLCNSSLGTGELYCNFTTPWVSLETRTVYCVLNDLTALSTEKTSNFYAGNTPPSAPTVDVLPDIATSLDDLICNITVNSTDIDNDSINYYFQWYNYSQLILTYGPTTDTTHILGTGNTTDSELWNCTVTPFDGKSMGNPSSDSVQLIGCNCPPCNAPVISTIPDQKRSFNQGSWNLNLSSYKSDIEDSGPNLVWSVQGVNPSFMNITINGDLITFAPQPDISGLDRIVFILTDTDGLIDTQEIKVSINRTLEFRNGWNLFSVPILENKSVQYTLAPLGNGNYGCGHDNAPPYDCVPASGDFAGYWSIIWTQNKSGSWIYFRPDVYYTFIPTQNLQTLEVDQGYWIDMNLSSPINLTLGYD